MIVKFVKLILLLITLFVYAIAEWSTNAQIVGQQIVSSCAGLSHACAVLDDKQMKCWGLRSSWGNSNSGKVGDESHELGPGIPFVNASNIPSAVKVSCGYTSVCALLDNGNVKCMGDNQFGQIGIGLPTSVIGKVTGYDGDNLPFVNLGTGVNVIDISAGLTHVCVTIAGNKIKCFGGNSSGQLGYENLDDIGTSPSQMGENLQLVDLGTNYQVSKFYSGPSCFHNCAILSRPLANAQKVKCWGYGGSYQLGYGRPNDKGDRVGEMGDNLPFVDLGVESRVIQLSLGSDFTCALLINYSLKCFGSAQYGQLGLGSTDDVILTGDDIPTVPINAGKNIMMIVAGESHSCLLYDDQVTVKCVGRNIRGQLGQGDKNNRGNTPTTTIPKIPAIDFGTLSLNISSIFAGGSFTCVIFVDSSVKCAGQNEFGQLAIGSAENVGDAIYEMGTNLTFSAILVAPTPSPTSPTTPTIPTASPFAPPTSSPIPKCNYTSSKLCNKDIHCIWKLVGSSNTCIFFDCSTLKQKKCGMQRKRCKWDKVANKCFSIA